MFDRSFRAVFLSIAIIGTITWLAIFEHNYQPRIYRYNEEVTILQVGDSELDFNHPPEAFSIWWQREKAVRVRTAGTDPIIKHIFYSVDGLTEEQVVIVGQSVSR